MYARQICKKHRRLAERQLLKKETLTIKKSEIYHLAQIAVINAQTIAPESKIEIMRVLIEQENLELFCEGREEENATL